MNFLDFFFHQGRPGIFWMEAAFLDDVAAGRPPGGEVESFQPAAGPSRIAHRWPDPSGPYLGQTPPGLEPEIFAKGLVSTGLNERDIMISPDGKTIYYGVMASGLVTVLVTRQESGRWTEPTTAGFHRDKDHACFEPALSADGETVFFLSNQAAPGQEEKGGWSNQNIFRCRIEKGIWSPPEALPAPVTSAAAEYFPSVAADGTLYFTREDTDGQPFLWSAEPRRDGFAEPVRLPAVVNIGTGCYNAFVAPDESFLVLCVKGHPDNLGKADYWISTRGPDNRWQPARNMGELFNGPGTRASSAFLSPDGKYFFFSSSRMAGFQGERLRRSDLHRCHVEPGGGSQDIWWVSARILDRFRG